MTDAEPNVLVLRGLITSGKTSVARAFAGKHKWSVLGMDYFTFALLPYEPRTNDDLVLSFENLVDALENSLSVGKSVIIEGDLTSIDEVDRHEVITKVAELYGAKIHNVLLTVNEEYAELRMKERAHPMLTSRRNEMNERIQSRKVEGEQSIDTSGKETEWTMGEVEKLVLDQT